MGSKSRDLACLGMAELSGVAQWTHCLSGEGPLRLASGTYGKQTWNLLDTSILRLAWSTARLEGGAWGQSLKGPWVERSEPVSKEDSWHERSQGCLKMARILLAA